MEDIKIAIVALVQGRERVIGIAWVDGDTMTCRISDKEVQEVLNSGEVGSLRLLPYPRKPMANLEGVNGG